jgi:hypothetical protein
MYPLVHKYLVLNRKVSVPGIGNFLIASTPAQVNGNQLQPPVSHIQFKPETALADKAFYEFVAHEMHIDEIDAIKRFHEFAYELKGNASYADGLQFPGIGTLKKQPNGSFVFEEEKMSIELYSPLNIASTAPVEKIIAKEIPTIEPDFSNVELEPVDAPAEQKDLWCVYAIILAVAGIAAIVYYYVVVA